MLDGEERTIIAEGDPRQLREHSADERVRAFFNRRPGEVHRERRKDVH
jgi:phospholipid/cholesterol/gamma-HCH transport system ATP-binding protein